MVGFDGWYEVSDQGRVKSLDRTITDALGRERRLRGQVIAGSTHMGGYHSVVLRRGNGRVHRLVHRLVAEAFIGSRPLGEVVRHLDGNPKNNFVDNLAYGTHADNMNDTVAHGRHHYAKRTHCKEGHPLEIVGKRRLCRTCKKAYMREYYLKNRG